MPSDAFNARTKLSTNAGDVTIYSLGALQRAGLGAVAKLPNSIKLLLEAVLRHVDGFCVEEHHVRALANWNAGNPGDQEIPFKCARVVLQDFTGVPAIVDFAAMRSAMSRLGGDPRRINPVIPADLVIDHSVQVDHYGSLNALELNAKLEFHRNRERYEFLRWGQSALDNLRVVPPATGIVHQVNLEYLAKVVFRREIEGEMVAVPDTLVGTDSHTTMINGLGVLGWGVGGIEAEAAMLGQPMYMLMPEVIGFRLTGKLPEGATATDLVLRVTQILRAHGVVGKFVEYFGDGLADMRLPDRATIANMAPEYGATMGFFPVDDQTLAYLRLTGRAADEIDLVERYCKEQGLFRTSSSPEPTFTQTLEFDMSTVEPSLAGPKRPQDRIALSAMKAEFNKALTQPVGPSGFALSADQLGATNDVRNNGDSFTLRHGSVVIAAITSCTNTSNPSVMLAAGLVAKKAAERGLRPKPWVKTSMAPGSRVVTDYLDKAGLTPFLDKLGFNTVGYGCTTCIGNSGPLPDAIREGVLESGLVVSSVLSGNRNFEARINPHIKANYLASPPLVVAYALAGTTDIDLTHDSLGDDADGKPVLLKDIWPTQREVNDAVSGFVLPEMFQQRYANVFEGEGEWKDIAIAGGDLFNWSEQSTYIQEPPFFVDLAPKAQPIEPITGARALCVVGDSVTTDHISPAGAIKADSPAGEFLQARGVAPGDFNSYGSRRGNDRVMTRGTFANVRFRNVLADGKEGGWTKHLPSGEITTVFEAANRYRHEGTPLIVIGGNDYGMGSSRDWAAKGTFLLGVKAVIVESFERIHRTNLVCMGVLPLQFNPGQGRESLGLGGGEVFDLTNLTDDLEPRARIHVVARDPDDGRTTEFDVVCRVDTPVEVEYYRNGGVLQTVLRKMMDA